MGSTLNLAQLQLGIQEDVCKVSFLYLLALRRYRRRSKGGGGNFMPPPAAGGWRGGPAAAGLNIGDNTLSLLTRGMASLCLLAESNPLGALL